MGERCRERLKKDHSQIVISNDNANDNLSLRREPYQSDEIFSGERRLSSVCHKLCVTLFGPRGTLPEQSFFLSF